MAELTSRRRRWWALTPALGLGALLLGGCAREGVSTFTTNQDVVLRMTQADDSAITARVPRGTVVQRWGWVGSECECWLVTTPQGTGFVYTRYLDMHLADSPLYE
ncbi:MAG: hypothetical protein JO032_19265 [Alphaproteobacteria bacterium]|nr:hypothetical protein [Alphaproteobacteria bacterium]MBV9554925.1 hypothetical protein [Alphaproteobacteria bacterium]